MNKLDGIIEVLGDLPEDLTGLNHYIGLEISGRLHVGSGLMTAIVIKQLQKRGANCKIFLADWHTLLNNKLGGDKDLIQSVAKGYFTNTFTSLFESVGVDLGKVEFILGSELYDNSDNYWERFAMIATKLSLGRVAKSTTVMGKKEGDARKFSDLVYPVMQINDIFEMQIDIAHSGSDQRKCHVIAREVSSRIDKAKPFAIHHPILLGILKPPKEVIEGKQDIREVLSEIKMSKSKPKSAIFLEDDETTVRAKVKSAFCMDGNVTYNPMLNWAEFMVFPLEGQLLGFDDFESLANAFKQGEVKSQELKSEIANFLVKYTKPVHQSMKDNVFRNSYLK